MPDRSSHQGLPEEWNHGSHAARGPYSAPTTADGFGSGTAGSHRARPSDGNGAGPTDGYGPDPADPFASRANSFGAASNDPLEPRTDSYGGSTADGFGARPASYGASTTDGFGVRVDSYGPGRADAFGARPGGTYGTGTADPFGDAAAFKTSTGDPFGQAGDAAAFKTSTGERFGSAGTATFAAVPAEAGAGRAEAERPTAANAEPAPKDAAEARGFLGALFDFGFTSFVTPKVIKVLYMLIVIGTVVSALVVTIIAFKASTVFGVLMLVFGDPLFILIVLAIYRIILEFFVVTFRVAEDIRALRDRAEQSLVPVSASLRSPGRTSRPAARHPRPRKRSAGWRRSAL